MTFNGKKNIFFDFSTAEKVPKFNEKYQIVQKKCKKCLQSSKNTIMVNNRGAEMRQINAKNTNNPVPSLIRLQNRVKKDRGYYE